MEAKYYTGTGHISVPKGIKNTIIELSAILAKKGYILRTGGEKGSDEAFEEGCDSIDSSLKEIYLPWEGFNDREGIVFDKNQEIMEDMKDFHINIKAITIKAKYKLGRDYWELKGRDMNTPSEFLIIYDTGDGSANYTHRLANRYKIPVYNLYEKEVLNKVKKYIKENS